MVTSSGVKNYELADVEVLPNGEIVMDARGRPVFICRPGGSRIVRVNLRGHFLSYPEGARQVGTEFTYMGISFLVERFSTSGQHVIKGIDGAEFDGRSYAIEAISTQPVESTTIHQLKAGAGG